ncbi:hypothetical protein K9L63_01670 [Candidatus Gracilibacteria bacterium]|nr:hypothetical protein [Candidatus Gracilibacteria bacterium]
MPENTPHTRNVFDPGKEIFSWTAHDYHPHKRGWVWLVVFCFIFFGSAFWAMLVGDWVMALTLFIAVAVYFWAHRNGEEKHNVTVYENGIQVDKKYFSMEKFIGYWFVYDPSVSVVNLQMEENSKKIMLQMGKNTPDFFRTNFARVELEELPDKKEGLVDLWVRALKL